MAPKAPIQFCRCGNPDADGQIKRTSDLFGTSPNGAISILNALNEMSSGTMPGLRTASGSMLLIIELFQTMVDVDIGFGSVLRDISNIMMGVAQIDVERGGNLSGEMEKAIKELNDQLSSLRAYAEKMKTRCWLKRLFNRDRAKVAEYREHCSEVLSIFQIEIGLDYNARRQNEANCEMLQAPFDQALASVKRPDIDLRPPFLPESHSPQTITYHAPKPSKVNGYKYSQQCLQSDYQNDEYQRDSYAGEHQFAQPAQGLHYDNSALNQNCAPSPPYQTHHTVNNIGSINTANFGTIHGNLEQRSCQSSAPCYGERKST